MLRVLMAETKRSWLNYKRYPADLFMTVFILTFTFYFMLQGARFMAGPSFEFGDRQDAVIVSYWAWTLSLLALSATARSLSSEASFGTLEQLYLSPFGPIRLFTIRMLGNLGLNVVTSAIPMLLLLAATGRWVAFPVEVILPILVVAIGAYGLGLALGAGVLVFKRITHGINLFQFVLLVLAMLPIEELEGPMGDLALLLPVAPAAGLMRDLMVRELPLDWTRLLVALATSLAYLLAAAALFSFADRKARTRGLIGQH